jgi:hypothetical protein
MRRKFIMSNLVNDFDFYEFFRFFSSSTYLHNYAINNPRGKRNFFFMNLIMTAPPLTADEATHTTIMKKRVSFSPKLDPHLSTHQT